MAKVYTLTEFSWDSVTSRYTASAEVFTFTRRPTKMSKKVKVEWRMRPRHSKSENQDRAKFRRSVSEIYDMTGFILMEERYDLEALTRRRSKYRFEMKDGGSEDKTLDMITPVVNIEGGGTYPPGDTPEDVYVVIMRSTFNQAAIKMIAGNVELVQYTMQLRRTTDSDITV